MYSVITCNACKTQISRQGPATSRSDQLSLERFFDPNTLFMKQAQNLCISAVLKFSKRKWKSGRVHIYIFPLININPDWQNSIGHLVRILIVSLENENPDMSGFFIFNWKMKNPDVSGFFFSIEKLKSGLDDITNFASPDWYLSKVKYKSGRVRIFIFQWKN